jgi:gliding motility-associated lipoprotein GldH
MGLASCGEEVFFDQTYDFKQSKWTDQDTATFTVHVDDTDVNYNFFLTLRVTKKYKYSNLWVKVITKAPDGSESVIAQRIDVSNTDGSWKGLISGSIVENRLHYKTNAFPLRGEYTFKIVQSVEQPVIDEILDIGMRIEAI